MFKAKEIEINDNKLNEDNFVIDYLAETERTSKKNPTQELITVSDVGKYD